MESPRSLLARIKEERAKEQQWKRETARRQRKFKKMEEEQKRQPEVGQLTSEALSSHNKEKIRRRLRSFAHPSSCPTTADSAITYATSLSRIDDTSSITSAVPLSLLGAVPPSTAAGQVGPITVMRSRLSQIVAAKTRSEEDALPLKSKVIAEEGVHSANGDPICLSPQQILKPRMNKQSTTFDDDPLVSSEQHHVVAADKKNLQQELPSIKSFQQNCESITKSTREFLDLEKRALQEEEKDESHGASSSGTKPKNHHESPAVVRVEVAAPTLFDALPPIHKKTNNYHSEKKSEVSIDEPATSARAEAVESKGISAPRPLPKAQIGTRAAFTTSSNGRPPRQQTAPPKKKRNDIEVFEDQPKGIMKPPIRRSESASRALRPLPVPAVLESIEVGKRSGAEIFRPDALERQQREASKSNNSKKKKRAVFFNELANGGDVFVNQDGVQFNVARSIGMSSTGGSLICSSAHSSSGAFSSAVPARSSGSAIALVQAMRQARKPDFQVREDSPLESEEEEVVHAPNHRPFLFGQPTPELFLDEDDQKCQAFIYNNNEVDQTSPSLFPPSVEVEETEIQSLAPPQVMLAPERPANVIPTGYSMEEKKLLEALNQLNQKQHDQEEEKRRKLEQKQAKTSCGGNQQALSYGMPEPRYKPKREMGTDGGQREVPRAAENLPIRSHVGNSIYNNSKKPSDGLRAGGANTTASRRQAGGRRYIGIQPL